jgi:hypothetical protein
LRILNHSLIEKKFHSFYSSPFDSSLNFSIKIFTYIYIQRSMLVDLIPYSYEQPPQLNKFFLSLEESFWE